MARKANTHPTDGELEILQALWAIGPATLGQVHEALSKNRAANKGTVAKTTVATMLGVMLQKKLVRRGDGPSGYAWSAAVNQRSTANGMVGKLLDYVFDGSAGRMVAHLLEDGRISGEELEEIARLRKQQQAKAKRK